MTTEVRISRRRAGHLAAAQIVSPTEADNLKPYSYDFKTEAYDALGVATTIP